MLGDISPQTVRITQQAVVYPSRDHVTSLRVERFDGRTYKPVDMTAVTRVILSFPEADPVIVYDSSVQAVFTHVGTTLTVDLSDYAMPASVLGCQIILYDAEHTAGQVLVDDIDAVVQFDFRNVSPVGGIPAPAVEYLTDAPIDGVTYARKDGLWVPVDALVSGVSSVNGQSGVVVLDAADVGADPAGTATTAAAAAVAAHTALADPHPQYLTPAEGNAAYDALGAATAAVSTHESDTTPHAFVQNMSKAGFNITAAQTAGVGEMVWNATDATMDLGLPGGVTLQAGQEFLLRGLNNSGATMADTTVVYISGAQGNRTVFSKAKANLATADKTIGVLTQDITNNQEGFATLAGLVRGIDTSAWAEGSELWLSAATAGLLTNIKPPAPNNAVSLGYVVRSHASLGSIYVRVAVRESIRELHDVVITAPTDGQVLVYDAATSTWVNEAGGGGSGEVNTASNLGTGSGLFAGKVGVDLQFKSLKAGAGVTLSSTATEVTIVASGAGGAVDSVNGQTGVVVLDTDDIAEGVSNLYFTNGRAATAAPVQTVDGQTGAVSLSSSYAPLSHVGDGGAAHSNAVAAGAAGFMTGADKTKLDGIATGATQNSSDAFLRARGNHTGTQLAATISDFALTTLATLMAGFTLIAGGTVSAADSLLVAIGKLQKQINDLFSGKQDTLVSGTNIKTVNGSTLLGSGNLTVSGGSVSNVYATAAISSGVLTLNFATAQTFGVMLNQNVTSLVLSGAVVDQRCEISVIFSQAALGGFSVAKPDNVMFADGVYNIASTVSSQLTLVTFTTVDAGTTWLMNSREVFSPVAPIVLPVITTENFVNNDEGDSTSGWTGSNATLATSASWLRTTKTSAGAASSTKALGTPISTDKDYIVYISGRVKTDGDTVAFIGIEAAGGAANGVFSVWFNSAAATSTYAVGAMSVQHYDGTTVKVSALAGATASATVAVNLAIHYDSKFDSITVWVRQSDGRWKFGARVGGIAFFNVSTMVQRFTDISTAGAWIEFDYFSVCLPNLAVIGDSITEGANGFSPNTGAGLTNDETTWMRHAPLYPSLRNNLVVNKGVGSNTSAMILSRIADVTALGAEAVFLHCSTNDAVGPVAQATRKTNIQSSVDAIVAAGAEVVLLNSVYGTESNSLNPGIRDYYKDSWDNYMSTVTGVSTKIDIMLPILSANGFMEDSMSDADDIHLNASGAAAVGAYITP